MADGEEGCEVDWSAQQGLHTVIERCRNNQVMHSSVPDAYKPLLFKSGVRIAFPAPTQAVTPPKHMSPSVHVHDAAAGPHMRDLPLGRRTSDMVGNGQSSVRAGYLGRRIRWR